MDATRKGMQRSSEMLARTPTSTSKSGKDANQPLGSLKESPVPPSPAQTRRLLRRAIYAIERLAVLEWFSCAAPLRPSIQATLHLYRYLNQELANKLI